MKTVLFAWELGRGLGHLFTIRRMAGRLKPHGIRTVAVVADLASASVLQRSCDEVVQAPAWPLSRQTAAQRALQSSATLNDILSSAGLADTFAVRELVVAWSSLFDQFKPDLLVADFAPLAALAARGTISTVQVGNGYTLPPDTMRRFPPLHRVARAQWNEADTLEAVNGAARYLGKSELAYLPQLFSGEARLVQSFAMLDPYYNQRVEQIDGPLFDAAPVARSGDVAGIYVYLSGSYRAPYGLAEVLAPFASKLRIHASSLSPSEMQTLAHKGARIDSEPVPLRDILASIRLVVHSGGSGVACEALAAGVPQLVLSNQIEQTLNGKALQKAGVGRLVEIYDHSSELSADMMASLSGDEAMLARAGDAGRSHRQHLLERDPVANAERTCLALLHGCSTTAP